jgi:succinate-acetate transporter protein
MQKKKEKIKNSVIVMVPNHPLLPDEADYDISISENKVIFNWHSFTKTHILQSMVSNVTMSFIIFYLSIIYFLLSAELSKT